MEAKSQNAVKDKRRISPRYEHLVVSSVYSTNWAEIEKLPNDDNKPEQTWNFSWWIQQPGKNESEERLGDITISELFNEFGRDG
jgi:hypothetical protein